MLQPGKMSSRIKLKSRRDQCNIVVTEYRDPRTIAMGEPGFIRIEGTSGHGAGSRRTRMGPSTTVPVNWACCFETSAKVASREFSMAKR